jgi:hypothetical protein
VKCTHEYRVPQIALSVDGRFPPHVTRLMEACGNTAVESEAIAETTRGESIETVGNTRAGWLTMRTECGLTRARADNASPGIY